MLRLGGWQAEVGEELSQEYYDHCKIFVNIKTVCLGQIN